MVIIFSHLTGRFHVPWAPPPAALQGNWFFGDSPFAHTLWQINDVACIFLYDYLFYLYIGMTKYFTNIMHLLNDY